MPNIFLGKHRVYRAYIYVLGNILHIQINASHIIYMLRKLPILTEVIEVNSPHYNVLWSVMIGPNVFVYI